MRPFAALERFFERLFERPSARLFHARLQPIQLQRRVERAMENGRLSAADRVVVPNRYVVRLAPADLSGFGDFADSLELELADAALRFARAHRYAVSDRPAVRLQADAAIDEGDVRVDASFSDGPMIPPPPPDAFVPATPPRPAPAEAAAAPVRVAPPDLRVSGDGPPVGASGIRSDGHPRAAAVEASPELGASVGHEAPVGPGVSVGPEPAAAPPPTPAPPPVAHMTRQAGLAQLDPTRTMIFELPTVDAPVVVLREVAPDGTQRQLTLEGGPVTIGRADDNNLVLRDSRVSRYHGRLAPRQGALVYRDLGSTNGSRVNGVEIDEVVLGAGDRIELGDTVLVVESVVGA